MTNTILNAIDTFFGVVIALLGIASVIVGIAVFAAIGGPITAAIVTLAVGIVALFALTE